MAISHSHRAYRTEHRRNDDTLFGIESKDGAPLSSSPGLLGRAAGGTLYIENFERLPPACQAISEHVCGPAK